MKIRRVPLTDDIIISLSGLIDDSQVKLKREPSHYDLSFFIDKVALSDADPKNNGKSVGKAKRIKAVLYWALENNIESGEELIHTIISNVRAVGGFRENTKNFTGSEAIESLRIALKYEGLILTLDGEVHPITLENLSARETTQALKSYIRRAQRGGEDAALVAGTGKDLMEATAAHILQEKTGSYPAQKNFPTLLGQAFTVLHLATPFEKPQKSEPAMMKFERSLYELACSVNMIRNKEGTGHGRPFKSNLTKIDSVAAVESIGLIAEYMLNKYEKSL
ncbi:abortive infection family protein [Filibacter tadaridae]|uniref:Abortive infection protein-like C-terminal domain-containing protein n=1 Tax=Filibacter tadaridae TaxID=2483811 RepID=A0A3P5XXB4_9BACL|nr:abortive infection family protein [Filibacter tadaridae]VDC33770.1 hypothetical protein FILTAD_03039 [Filibacter tadaridae]